MSDFYRQRENKITKFSYYSRQNTYLNVTRTQDQLLMSGCLAFKKRLIVKLNNMP